MKNKTKTILFASLIAAMILPFSGMQFAEAKTNNISDTSMVEFIIETIQNEGTTVTEKIIEGKTYTVTKIVTQIQDDKYRVINKLAIDGELQSKDRFKITENDDGTYNLYSKKLGIDETFTRELPFSTLGSGYSSYTGASIVLNDSETGTASTVNLYDSFSACSTLNQGVMEGEVTPSVVDVTWEASPVYMHYCFWQHQWEHGYVEYENETHQLVSEPNHSDRRSSHAFSHSNGSSSATYEVTAMFFYGEW